MKNTLLLVLILWLTAWFLSPTCGLVEYVVSERNEDSGFMRLSAVAIPEEKRPSALSYLLVGLEDSRLVMESGRQETVYSFSISGHRKSCPETILPDMRITVPGDIRQQTIAYCDERPELSVTLCYNLIGLVNDHLSSAHVPNMPLTCAVVEPGMEENLLSGCRRNGLKIVIVHLATEKAHWSATHAQVINLMYARRHGYDFVSLGCPPLSGGDREEHIWCSFDQVRANWAKPKIILDHLQQYHYVLLLDSDAYISDPSTTIEEMIRRHLQDSGKSILVPNNCLAEIKGDPTSWSCWSDGLNIAAVLVQNSSQARAALEEWYQAPQVNFDPNVENSSGCKDLVYPQWDKSWMANDQSCLDRLYNFREPIYKTIKVLSNIDTYYYIGGAENAWITHWFGGNKDMSTVGNAISRDAHTAVSQQVYETLQPKIQRNMWKKHPELKFTCGSHICTDDDRLDISVAHISRMAEPDLPDHKYLMYMLLRSSGLVVVTHSFNGVDWPLELSQSIGPFNRPAKHEGDPVHWDSVVNRPHVLYHAEQYHMWFTGQTLSTSSIGYATSYDGFKWSKWVEPVLSAFESWENQNIMCSHTLFDKRQSQFRMWYSAGDRFKPTAIGHAVSCDGVNWKRTSKKPIFTPRKDISWEAHRVSCPSVVFNGEYYYMFYTGNGFEDSNGTYFGIARSKNGISSWERYKHNPIIQPTADSWDSEATYKPWPIFVDDHWTVWYTGSRNNSKSSSSFIEHSVGFATLEGYDLFTN